MKISFGSIYLRKDKLNSQQKAVVNEIENHLQMRRNIKIDEKTTTTPFSVHSQHAYMPIVVKRTEINASPNNENIIMEVLNDNKIPYESSHTNQQSPITLFGFEKFNKLI